MPYRYPPEFRRKVLGLLAAGRSVASLSADLGVSDQTIYNWRRQDAIDRGLEPGLMSSETEELRAARRRITELEKWSPFLCRPPRYLPTVIELPP